MLKFEMRSTTVSNSLHAIILVTTTLTINTMEPQMLAQTVYVTVCQRWFVSVQISRDSRD